MEAGCEGGAPLYQATADPLMTLVAAENHPDAKERQELHHSMQIHWWNTTACRYTCRTPPGATPQHADTLVEHHQEQHHSIQIHW